MKKYLLSIRLNLVKFLCLLGRVGVIHFLFGVLATVYFHPSGWLLLPTIILVLLRPRLMSQFLAGVLTTGAILSLLSVLRASEVTHGVVTDVRNYSYSQRVELIAFPILERVEVEAKLYPRYRMGNIVELSEQRTTDDLESASEADNFSIVSNSNAKVIKMKQPPFSQILNTRNILVEYINYSLPEPEASLAIGLLLGSNPEFDDQLKTELRNTGLGHIVSVSGYNVGLIVIALLFAGKKAPRKKMLIVAMCIIPLFLIFVGIFNWPALRAVIMAEIFLASKLVGRRVNILLCLIYATALISLIDESIFADISFQLSALALLGIVLFSKPIGHLMSKVPSVIREIWSGTLAVMLSTFPVVVLNFGELTLASLVSNLIFLPFIPILMLVSCLGLLFQQIPLLGKLLWGGVYYLLHALIQMNSIISSSNIGKVDTQLGLFSVLLLLIALLAIGNYLLIRSNFKQ